MQPCNRWLVGLEIDLLECSKPFVNSNFKGCDNIFYIFLFGLVAFRGFLDVTVKMWKMSIASLPQLFLATSLVILLLGKLTFMFNLLDIIKHTRRRIK